MKKFFMAIVCLMTMVISANAQPYHPIIQKAYENWVKYNEDKTIEDFIRIKFENVHSYYYQNIGSSEHLKEIIEKEYNEYLRNPKPYKSSRASIHKLIYPEAYHSDKYGHFDNGNCTHENGCICRKQSSSNLLRTYASQYEAAKEEYLKFSEGFGDYHNGHRGYDGYPCLICIEEYKALGGGELYDKLLRKRFENWKKSDDYKSKSLERQNMLKSIKEKMIKREIEQKKNFDEIIKRTK